MASTIEIRQSMAFGKLRSIYVEQQSLFLITTLDYSNLRANVVQHRALQDLAQAECTSTKLAPEYFLFLTGQSVHFRQAQEVCDENHMTLPQPQTNAQRLAISLFLTQNKLNVTFLDTKFDFKTLTHQDSDGVLLGEQFPSHLPIDINNEYWETRPWPETHNQIGATFYLNHKGEILFDEHYNVLLNNFNDYHDIDSFQEMNRLWHTAPVMCQKPVGSQCNKKAEAILRRLDLDTERYIGLGTNTLGPEYPAVQPPSGTPQLEYRPNRAATASKVHKAFTNPAPSPLHVNLRNPRFAWAALIPIAGFLTSFLGDILTNTSFSKAKTMSQLANETVKYMQRTAKKTQPITIGKELAKPTLSMDQFGPHSKELSTQFNDEYAEFNTLLNQLSEGTTPIQILQNANIDEKFYHKQGLLPVLDPTLTQSVILPDSNPGSTILHIITKVPVINPHKWDIYQILSPTIFIQGLPLRPIISGNYFALNQNMDKVISIKNPEHCDRGICPKQTQQFDIDGLPCGPAQFFNVTIQKCFLDNSSPEPSILVSDKNNAVISLPPTHSDMAIANCPQGKLGPEKTFELHGLSTITIPPGCTVHLRTLGRTLFGAPLLKTMVVENKLHKSTTNNASPLNATNVNAIRTLAVDIIQDIASNSLTNKKTTAYLIGAIIIVLTCLTSLALYLASKGRIYVQKIKTQLRNRQAAHDIQLQGLVSHTGAQGAAAGLDQTINPTAPPSGTQAKNTDPFPACM